VLAVRNPARSIGKHHQPTTSRNQTEFKLRPTIERLLQPKQQPAPPSPDMHRLGHTPTWTSVFGHGTAKPE